MITVEVLRSVEILNGLTDDELSVIESCCEEVPLKGDTIVFSEKDSADHLYRLLDGNVSIRYRLPHRKTAADHSIATIMPGGTFGWSSLRPNAEYRFSAHCVGENGRAVRFARDRLLSVLDKQPRIGYIVMKNLATVIGSRFIALQNEIARRDGQDFIDGW